MTQAALKSVANQKIDFIDLATQQNRIRPQVEQAILKILDHGAYIMGPEIAALENELADFCGCTYALSCSSGTDALLMVLMAQGIGPGDAVFLPAFTFPATPESVALLGAHPVLVDVYPDTFNMNPEALQDAITIAQRNGLTPKAIIPVDLFGQPVDYAALEEIANKNDLWILCDSCQSFGATYKERSVGNIGLATATSFFPAKPLGCYGDGGAVFTNNKDLYECMKSIRIHGQGVDKYDNVRVGLNARMDSIQAAVLLEKLKIFPDEIAQRQIVAKRYSDSLKDIVSVPYVRDDCTSVWAQYTILLPNQASRDSLQSYLSTQNIPSVVYYSKPLQEQVAYKGYYLEGQDLSVSKVLSNRVLSLPMHAYLTEDVQDRITDAIHTWANLNR